MTYDDEIKTFNMRIELIIYALAKYHLNGRNDLLWRNLS